MSEATPNEELRELVERWRNIANEESSSSRAKTYWDCADALEVMIVMRETPTRVDEQYRCPECDNNQWYMGYEVTEDWSESIHECTECGWVGTP